MAFKYKYLLLAFLLIAAAVAMYVVFTMNAYDPGGPYLLSIDTDDENWVLNPDGTVYTLTDPDEILQGKWVDNNMLILYRDDAEFFYVIVVSDDKTTAKIYGNNPGLGSELSRKNADAVIATTNTNMTSTGHLSLYTPEEAA